MGEQTDNRHAGIDLADSHDTPIHNKIADKKNFWKQACCWVPVGVVYFAGELNVVVASMTSFEGVLHLSDEYHMQSKALYYSTDSLYFTLQMCNVPGKLQS